MMCEPCTFSTPCATKRPSGELRVQYADEYVTSWSTRHCPRFGTSQPWVANGLSARHWRGSVAAPQPYIAIMEMRLVARQPVVCIALTCAATSAEMPCAHDCGGGSLGSVSSSIG